MTGPAPVTSRAFRCFDSDCEIHAIDVADDDLDRAVAWTQAQHERFTRFAPESELSRFNAAAGSWAEVSADLEALLRACLDAHAMSGGLVHAGVLRALLAAGYTRTFAEGATPATPAKAAAPAPLPDLLAVRRGEARLERGSAIDLGGIAKGWLADRLAERLGADLVVNFGGDLRARGGGPTGEGWPVGLGTDTVLLRDMGAATSGTQKRSWGDGLHHLIDPRTGRPAASDLSEVSVIARTAFEAEVGAKAALLLGAAAAEPWLRTRALGWRLA